MTSDSYHRFTRTLKKILRDKKISYREVAAQLEVSEQTIKRVFYGDDADFGRLDAICNVAGVGFFDVAKLASEEPERTFSYTPEQEEFFASYPHHYEFFRLLRDHMAVGELQKKFGLTKRSVEIYLRDLEKIGVLERLPELNCRVLVPMSPVGCNWLDGGALNRRYAYEEQRDLIESFHQRHQSPGSLTHSTHTVSKPLFEDFRKDLNQLAAHYRKRSYRESKVVPDEEKKRCEWLLVIRHDWHPESRYDPVNLD